MAFLRTPTPEQSAEQAAADAARQAKPWTESEICQALGADMDSPFYYRQQFVVVPNLSWGFFTDREADLIVCSRGGYLSEVEIKVSAQDWRQDAEKRKWLYAKIDGKWNPNLLASQNWKHVKRFYYAAPHDLAVKWEDFDLPPWAGVIALRRGRFNVERQYVFTVLRPAKANRHAESLVSSQMADLARLAALRIWTRPALEEADVK